MNKRGRTKPYPQIAKDRISASRALDYLLDVIAGDAVPDAERCRNARWAVDKVVPTAAQEQTITHDGELVVRWKS